MNMATPKKPTDNNLTLATIRIKSNDAVSVAQSYFTSEEKFKDEKKAELEKLLNEHESTAREKVKESDLQNEEYEHIQGLSPTDKRNILNIKREKWSLAELKGIVENVDKCQKRLEREQKASNFIASCVTLTTLMTRIQGQLASTNVEDVEIARAALASVPEKVARNFGLQHEWNVSVASKEYEKQLDYYTKAKRDETYWANEQVRIMYDPSAHGKNYDDSALKVSEKLSKASSTKDRNFGSMRDAKGRLQDASRALEGAKRAEMAPSGASGPSLRGSDESRTFTPSVGRRRVNELPVDIPTEEIIPRVSDGYALIRENPSPKRIIQIAWLSNINKEIDNLDIQKPLINETGDLDAQRRLIKDLVRLGACMALRSDITPTPFGKLRKVLKEQIDETVKVIRRQNSDIRFSDDKDVMKSASDLFIKHFPDGIKYQPKKSAVPIQKTDSFRL